jgi:HrpA-like RNA helicase
VDHREVDKVKAKMSHEAGDHMMLIELFQEYQQSKNSEKWCKENYVHLKSMKFAQNTWIKLRNICKERNVGYL